MGKRMTKKKGDYFIEILSSYLSAPELTLSIVVKDMEMLAQKSPKWQSCTIEEHIRLFLNKYRELVRSQENH